MSNSNFLLSEGVRADIALPFWQEAGILASQNSNALNIVNSSSATARRWVAPYSGRVVSISIGADANLTAGTITVECFVNNALSQSFPAISSSDSLPKLLTLATPATFTAGQTVDFRYSSDAGVSTLSVLAIFPNIVFD